MELTHSALVLTSHTATIYGGEGTDTLVLSETGGDGHTDAGLKNVAGFEVLSVAETADADIVLGLEAQDAGIRKVVLTAAATQTDVNASAFTTAIHLVTEGSSATASDLEGGNGADTIVGGANTNTLETNRGNDTLTGGDGIDTFVITDSGAAQTVKITDLGVTGDADIVTISNALATVDATIVAGFTAGVSAFAVGSTFNGTVTDTLSNGDAISFDAVTGKGLNDLDASAVKANIDLRGSDFADTITAGDGDDSMAGGLLGDKLTGGAGDEVFYAAVNASGNEQVAADTIVGGTGTNTFELRNTDAITAEFDFDHISDLLSISTTDVDGDAANSGEAASHLLGDHRSNHSDS